MRTSAPSNVTGTSERFVVRGAPDVGFVFDTTRRLVAGRVMVLAQLSSLPIAIAYFYLAMFGTVDLTTPPGLLLLGAFVLLVILLRRAARGSARELQECARTELAQLAEPCNSVGLARIRVRGAPAEIAVVFTASTVDRSVRQRQFRWLTAWTARMPAAAAILGFMIMTGVGRIPFFLFGPSGAVVCGLAVVAIWTMSEIQHSRCVVVDGRRLTVTETSWLGRERVVAEVRLASASIHIDFSARSLLVAGKEEGPVELNLSRFLNRYRLAGALIANALDSSTAFPFDGLGDWGTVCEYGRNR